MASSFMELDTRQIAYCKMECAQAIKEMALKGIDTSPYFKALNNIDMIDVHKCDGYLQMVPSNDLLDIMRRMEDALDGC